MADIPRIKFNSPWTVENIETELNGTKNARGNLTMTEKLAQKVETSTYSTDKTALDAEIAAIANLGAKNLLNFDGIGSKQGNASNIDFTYNSDGSVTVNGSVDNTGNAYVNLTLSSTSINAHGAPDFCDGNFKLSGCPANDAGLSLRTTGTGYTASVDTGNGVEINSADEGVTVRIAVFVAKGSTISNLTVKPMIRRKEIADSTHQPYAPTNRELYEMILALQSGTRSLPTQTEPEEQEDR